MVEPPLQEISQLTAVELRNALAAGDLSAREAAEHFLQAIESRNRQLGAFVTVTAEQALKDAAASDALHARLAREGRREELPALHGMPTAFKDLTDVAGVPTTHGSAALEHKPAPEDGALAATLKGQGVISLGKTQVPEFGLTAYSENRVAPPSRNPHALGRSSGGSSGGSAAAVAAGLVPFAPGTDGGGSIRIPAGACGLVGLKPGRGLVPGGASAGDAAKLVVAGPLARTAADAALLMDALVPRDQAPDGGYLANVGQAPEPLRIGVSLDSPWAGIYPFQIDEEAADALELGTKLLEKAGHSVTEAGIRYDNRYPEAFTTAWTAGVGSARIAPQREALLTPLTRTFRRRAQQRSASKVNEALSFLRQFEHDTLAQYAEWDLILMPTLAQTPRPIGWFTGGGHSGEPWPSEWAGDADEDYKRQCEYAPWSSMVNVCGLPAISIPVHTTASGLPMGIQIIGRPGSELQLLQLAAVLEAR
ncbi:amidase [Paenarthrobacter sp. MSM-2-10-13]|uniref:amidase n=1 Tax=Paenarthrobacter sp. MSM-2-10-13 TaxID=2717318 RepID=UPI00141F12CF|nr:MULTISPECIES: amidase [unclassified Paenarthrobacter]MCM0616231.1 amidase [Paenarthrobacter sp. TYUT067]NHW48811.1 amidase [Paenarthrobacter sp. MSM-2-10-13]